MIGHNSLSSTAGGVTLAVAALFGMSLIYQPLEAAPFADYSLFAPPRIVEGPLSPAYGLPSLTDPSLPGWDANAVLTVSVGPIPPPTLDNSTLILTIPIDDTSPTTPWETNLDSSRYSQLALKNSI